MSDSASSSLCLNPGILTPSKAQHLPNATHRAVFKMLELSTDEKNQTEYRKMSIRAQVTLILCWLKG